MCKIRVPDISMAYAFCIHAVAGHHRFQITCCHESCAEVDIKHIIFLKWKHLNEVSSCSSKWNHAMSFQESFDIGLIWEMQLLWWIEYLAILIWATHQCNNLLQIQLLRWLSFVSYFSYLLFFFSQILIWTSPWGVCFLCRSLLISHLHFKQYLCKQLNPRGPRS